MRISGELWGAVLVSGPNGKAFLRQTPKRRRARTPEQRAAEARFRPVAAAWRALSPLEAGEWRRVAQAQGRNPYALFTGLASKCLQLRPDAPVPSGPPETAFTGDGIAVRASAPEGLWGLRYEANGPNAPGVVTELLSQKLVNANRKPPLGGYRTRAFAPFAAGALTRDVPCEPGAWACAVRFVREATGQEVGLVEIGVVAVG